MTERISIHGLQVAKSLHNFLEQEAIPGTGVKSDEFWLEFAKLIHDLAPKNRALLDERQRLQKALNSWYENTLVQSKTKLPIKVFYKNKTILNLYQQK